MKQVHLFIMAFILSGCVEMAVKAGCFLDEPIEKIPEERTANFSFAIAYKYRDQRYDIADVGTCTYVGRSCDGRGLHNKWDFKLQSGSDKLRPKGITTDLSLYFPTGGCQSLMEGNLVPYNTGVSVDPYRGSASSWDPIGTQRKIDSLGIEVTSYQIVRLP
ncbi:hypothetical protein [Microbulbifer marinus]|nr:hypothetical protein [Microbulbifer marinus]